MTERITELAAALEQFLRDLRPRLENRAARFRTLVAADLARQLQAEAANGAQLAKIRAQALDRLAASSQAELVQAIRDGRFDPASARAVLLKAAAAELAITHPRFDTRIDLP